jgi:hypothetical protein
MKPGWEEQKPKADMPKNTPRSASRLSATKTWGIARNFYFGSGAGDSTGRSLTIAAQTSPESEWQCDSVGPA